MMVSKAALAMVVARSLPPGNIRDLVDYARSNAGHAPGTVLLRRELLWQLARARGEPRID